MQCVVFWYVCKREETPFKLIKILFIQINMKYLEDESVSRLKGQTIIKTCSEPISLIAIHHCEPHISFTIFFKGYVKINCMILTR